MGRKNHTTTAELATQAGIGYDEARRFLKAMLDNLKMGREVRLTGFGTFSISRLKLRRIKTGIVDTPVTMRPRNVIRFSRSRIAAAFINDEHQRGW
jgi:nucleoid DNA-binding protein